MLAHVLQPDTQATLLLCSHFGQFSKNEVQPLTLSEYNKLAGWLVQHQMRPADLLETHGQMKLAEEIGLDRDRLLTLLKRGVTLGFAVEKWVGQGLWILSRGDRTYPQRLKERLRHQAPPILYGVGDQSSLNQGGLAIVGSRHVDEDGMDYTRRVAQACVQTEMQVVSGGARGVDQISMLSALEAGGSVVGVLADSLSKTSLASKYRNYLLQNQLTLVSCYDPDAGFSIGNAMGRNKYVYALADYGLVVSADLGKGGTWAGAIEALQRYQSTSVFVRNVENLPGNQVLLQKGAHSFPDPPWSAMRNLLAEMVEPLVEIKPAISANGSNSHHPSETSSSTSTVEVLKSTHVIEDPPEIYNQVLQILCHYLQKPIDKKTLAKQLNAQSENVTESQLSKWLERAISEGILKTEKVKRQTVYVLANRESQVLIDPFERQLSLLK